MKKSNFALLLALLLPATVASAQAKMDDMKGMSMSSQPATVGQPTHTTKGTVKKVDAPAAVVTLAHEPVKTLGWPAMTMGFKIKDRSLLDKLSEGNSVEFDFVQAGKDYVITAVR